MIDHQLKTDPDVYDDTWRGVKTFEIRKDDRGYEVGDMLQLRRTLHTGDEMRNGKPLVYTGETCCVKVLHILRGPCYGLADGWAIMSVQLAR